MTAESSHPPVENWDSFMARLEPWKEFMPEEDFETAMALTDAAYGMGKIRPPQVAFRLTGERYFEHLRGVALILIDECHFDKPEHLPMIWGSLLHDGPEDTSMFGNAMKLPYSRWIKRVKIVLSRTFSPETAEIIASVTEPRINGREVHNEEEALAIKYQNLREGPIEGLMVKMADRLNNLRTFVLKASGKTLEEKIWETEQILLPIFDRARTKYPVEAGYLINQIKGQVEFLRVNPPTEVVA
jgi:(p)ppGpp synthase/HD superfamily hydrolase